MTLILQNPCALRRPRCTAPASVLRSSSFHSNAALRPRSRQARTLRGRACCLPPISAALFNSTKKAIDVKASDGQAEPLGPSVTKTGINFAVYSAHATAMKLCLFDADNTPVTELDMVKTGDVFHVEAVGCPRVNVLYGVRVSGEGGWETGHRWDDKRVVLDPYAPLVAGRKKFGVRDDFEQFKPKVGSIFRGTFDFESRPFDWGRGYQRPNLHLKDLVIYECSVRCFTASPTSRLPEDKRGTYAGLAAKVDHLKQLGVNAVELLPVFEYDELEFQRDKNPRAHMVNIWGYSHINFFAPMSRFGSAGRGPAAAAREFKEMVKTLHNNGIEVILDVVYNHTAEGSDVNPYILSHRAIDTSTYYMMDQQQYVQLLNYSGCGNTVNANNPATAAQIVASLRQWVDEYHVDGFRFDLATCLCRDNKGNLIGAPPLIRAISKDPVLSKVKLIAEPWDCGAYQVGSFPNWDIWAEWNGQYRDIVRRFIKGDGGLKSDFATKLAGSADLYHVNKRKPYHSVNFVIAHDGFTLHDLVSYNNKHNGANGEDGKDGTNDNFSWNCGKEGRSSDEGVLALRNRQMRNYHLALMISQGTPMVLAGDEYAQTRNGNNNWYGHDSDMTHFDWDALERERDGWFRFYSSLIKFRKESPLLGVSDFLDDGDVTWHETDWHNPESKFLAFSIHDTHGQGCGDLYCAFNAHHVSLDIDLPPAPDGQKWCRLVDTNLPSPRDWTEGGNKGVDSVYCIHAFSSILLISKPA